MSRLPNQWSNKAGRRQFLQGSAAAGAGFLAASLPGRVLGQDKVTVVNSIRSLSNPYHASWNQGGEAFAKWAGADYATLVTEGNSEKGIADIKAMIAKTGGNMVLNVDPNESPDARPIVKPVLRPASMSRPNGTNPRTCIPGTSIHTTSPTSRSTANPTARLWRRRCSPPWAVRAASWRSAASCRMCQRLSVRQG